MHHKEFFQFASQFISPKKLERFHSIVNNRTRHLCVVMEDIFQPHNASAVVRSAECLGIQDIHIIENDFRYEINPDVVVGSTKWISMHYYNRLANNTVNCFTRLRERGYRIIGTSPHQNSIALSDLPIDQKMALVLGTEKVGMSDLALGLCDEIILIPMHGFTESLNISVSGAVCMYDIMHRLRNSNILWQLSEEEKYQLLADWVKKSLNRPDILEDEFLKYRRSHL